MGNELVAPTAPTLVNPRQGKCTDGRDSRSNVADDLEQLPKAVVRLPMRMPSGYAKIP